MSQPFRFIFRLYEVLSKHGPLQRIQQLKSKLAPLQEILLWPYYLDTYIHLKWNIFLSSFLPTLPSFFSSWVPPPPPLVSLTMGWVSRTPPSGTTTISPPGRGAPCCVQITGSARPGLGSIQNHPRNLKGQSKFDKSMKLIKSSGVGSNLQPKSW